MYRNEMQRRVLYGTILQMKKMNKTNEEIAKTLNISEATVRLAIKTLTLKEES